jgi:hypothetical protein
VIPGGNCPSGKGFPRSAARRGKELPCPAVGILPFETCEDLVSLPDLHCRSPVTDQEVEVQVLIAIDENPFPGILGRFQEQPLLGKGVRNRPEMVGEELERIQKVRVQEGCPGIGIQGIQHLCQPGVVLAGYLQHAVRENRQIQGIDHRHHSRQGLGDHGAIPQMPRVRHPILISFISFRICVREEEQDWLVYCHIAVRERVTVPELEGATGLPRPAVEASAARLVQGMLVEREGEALRAMTIGESLAKCRINSSGSSPIVIENGVIRVRKEDR